MNSLSLGAAATIESVIEATLANYAAYGHWNREVSLTSAWMVALKSSGLARPLGRSGKVVFDCHEFTGDPEKAHGDIGILVKLTMPDGRTLKGFTALEAKRSYDTAPKYAELKFDQLERHLQHTNHHHVLLYSRQKVAVPGGGPAVHAVIAPTKLVSALRDQSELLEQSGIRFASQLERIFLGHDLDFDKAAVAAILSGDKAFRHVLTAHATRSIKQAPDLCDMVPNISCYRKSLAVELYQSQSNHSKVSKQQHVGLSLPLPSPSQSQKRGGPRL